MRDRDFSTTMSEEEVTYACAALIVGAALDEDRQKEDRNLKWCEKWLLKRDLKGSFIDLHQE